MSILTWYQFLCDYLFVGQRTNVGQVIHLVHLSVNQSSVSISNRLLIIHKLNLQIWQIEYTRLNIYRIHYCLQQTEWPQDNAIHQVNLGRKQFPVLSQKGDNRTSFPTPRSQGIWHSIHLNEYHFWNETKSIESFVDIYIQYQFVGRHLSELRGMKTVFFFYTAQVVI